MGSLISVIVPVYNVRFYLKDCIESIINQSYQNLEILIIDDGSTDGSEKICDSLKELDNRISVFHKKNGGLSDARNYGLKKSRGDYYSFIDSDDILHPDFFSKLINIGNKTGADIISCDIQNVYDHKIAEDFCAGKQENVRVFKKEEILKEYFDTKKDRIIYHGLCMKIYKKELFKDLWFSLGKLHEDLYITYKLLDRCKCFAYTDLPMYYYFQNNPLSITNNYTSRNFEDECDALFDMCDYFYEREEYDSVREFVSFQLFDIFVRSEAFIDEYQDSDRRIKAIRWEKENIWKVKNISLAKKILIYVFMDRINDYIRLRDRIRQL